MIIAVFVSFALIPSLFGFTLTLSTLKFMETAIVLDTDIAGFRAKPDAEGRQPAAVKIKLQNGSSLYSYEEGVPRRGLKTGDRHRIAYQSDSPYSFRFADFWSLWLWPIVNAFLVLILIILLPVGLRCLPTMKWRRYQALEAETDVHLYFNQNGFRLSGKSGAKNGFTKVSYSYETAFDVETSDVESGPTVLTKNKLSFLDKFGSEIAFLAIACCAYFFKLAFQVIVVFLFFTIWSAFILQQYREGRKTHFLDRRLTEATGKVIAFDEKIINDTKLYAPIIEFHNEERGTLKTVLNRADFPAQYDIGESITFLYDKKNPKKAKLRQKQILGFDYFSFAIILGFIFMSIITLAIFILA